MIERILPAVVASAEARSDPPGVVLFPEEEAVLARCVDKRRREFATARACARRALAALGVPAVAILPGAKGAPRWPAGIVGSITHCDGYRAAAVARTAEVASVGIDAEPHDVLPEGVLEVVSLPEERTRLRELAGGVPDVCWDRVLFSAKESVYKAWFPLAGRWLGFDEALVDIDPAGGTFTARLLVPGPRVAGRELSGFCGGWWVEDGLVLTAITHPPAGVL